jgi:hypothetical protein
MTSSQRQKRHFKIRRNARTTPRKRQPRGKKVAK